MVHCCGACAKPHVDSLVNTATRPSLLAETFLEERPFPEPGTRGEKQPLWFLRAQARGDTVGPGWRWRGGSDISSSITEEPQPIGSHGRCGKDPGGGKGREEERWDWQDTHRASGRRGSPEAVNPAG